MSSWYIYHVSDRSSVMCLGESGWVWTLSKDVQREQAWLACVPVLLWHFLEMPGSCTERILEGWWELQGTCGYASAASATGAWDCLLTSLPVLRRLFLGKDGMCALYWSGWRALSTCWETWIALGQNSAHLVVYIVGIPGRAESLSCPLSEHLFLCMKSSFACLFFLPFETTST